MLKKRIEYEDFDGNKRSEDFYFNLTKTEMTLAQTSIDGGLVNKLQKINDAQNVPEIVKTFVELVDMSYGVKSDDGKRFVKNKELLDEFKSTNAYDQLFMEVLANPKDAVGFLIGIMPSDIGEKLKNDPDLMNKLNKLNE